MTLHFFRNHECDGWYDYIYDEKTGQYKRVPKRLNRITDPEDRKGLLDP